MKTADKRTRAVPVNDRGLRIGEGHPRAILKDWEVDVLIELREEQGWSFARLAEHFDIGKSTAYDYCIGRRRGQLAVRWVTVRVPAK